MMRANRWPCLSLRRLGIAAVAAICAQSACASGGPNDGGLDATFGTSGAGYTIIDFGNGTDAHQDGAHRLVRQPDGKFIAVGSVDSAYAQGHQAIGLVRIDNNGAIDPSFGNVGTPGKVVLNPAAGEDVTGNGIALLPDGHVIVVGTYSNPTHYGQLFNFPANGNGFTNAAGSSGSQFNDVLALPDGRLVVGGSAPGISGLSDPLTNDFLISVFTSALNNVQQMWLPFDQGGSHDDIVQHIAFVNAADAASGRLGYLYAIGSVALPNFPSGHDDIDCGVVKLGVYSSGVVLRLDTSFGASGKLVLGVNAAWKATNNWGIDGHAYCRGIAIGKDASLSIAGERYYFGFNNDHATADDSAGFAAKLDANGAVAANFSYNSSSPGFGFYGNALGALVWYEGFWFSLIQTNGLPLFGGLYEFDCGAGTNNRSWGLRTSATGAPDSAYAPSFCQAPRPSTDTGYDVALDGVLDAGRLVTVGNVFSSVQPASATDFVFIRHRSDLIFTDNFDQQY